MTKIGNVFALILSASIITSALLFVQHEPEQPGYSLYFCPQDACDRAVIRAIYSANSTIDVAIYSFTLDSISDALADAKARGVSVRVILDREQAASEYSEYEKLLESGIDARISENPYYMHNKFAVIDGKIVITGSYNWSDRATNGNDENLLIISSEDMAFKYASNFAALDAWVN